MIVGQVGYFAEVVELFLRRKGAAAFFAHCHGKFGFPDGANIVLVFQGNHVDRTNVGAGATGNAGLGGLVKRGGHGAGAATAFKADGSNTHYLAAGAHALAAENAALVILLKPGFLHPDLRGKGDEPRVIGIAGKQKLDHQFAHVHHAVGNGLYLKAFGHLKVAGGHQAGALVMHDLYHAEPAGAVGYELFITAQVRNIC